MDSKPHQEGATPDKAPKDEEPKKPEEQDDTEYLQPNWD